MTEFDDLAADYDATRGGEKRGEEYAVDIDAYLPQGEGPVLEIGVGTGVVALGLQRRGRTVVGVDLSFPMARRARERLGPVVVHCDALAMGVRTASVAHATSVWVVHSVADPVRLFEEAARVLRPGGRYVVCAVQRPDPGDEIGAVLTEMAARVDKLRGAARPRQVTADEVVGWAAPAGFAATVHRLQRSWVGRPSDDLTAIALRQWPAMRELDDEALADATRPAVAALSALPDVDTVRRATADMVVLEKR